MTKTGFCLNVSAESPWWWNTDVTDIYPIASESGKEKLY